MLYTETNININDESKKPLELGSEKFTKELVQGLIRNSRSNADSPESRAQAYEDAQNYMTLHNSLKNFPKKIKKIKGELKNVRLDLNDVEMELSEKPNNMVFAKLSNERGHGQNSIIYTMGDNPDDETVELFNEHRELVEMEQKLIVEKENYEELMEKARKKIEEMEDQINLVYLQFQYFQYYYSLK